ncbi:MAG: type IV pilus biogenesis protein EbsA [Cyanobacteriota bacterium]|nr:type IV pilus biogenesis protein EbsA [Cyanobacteriota bacterium]
MASAWGILGERRSRALPPLSDAALRALFAPYCGGVAREVELLAALQLLNQQQLQGFRSVEGGLGHPYTLSWLAVRSPLETTRCNLRFPERPDLLYDFELVTHQLVSWLMDCREEEHGSVDLPDGFWQWLLLGADPAVEA